MAYSNVKFSAVLEGFIRKIREEPNLTYDVCGETARLNKHRECVCVYVLGYLHQRADKRHGNPPQGNQEPLIVTEKVGRTAGELWVSKSMKCDIFPFSAL